MQFANNIISKSFNFKKEAAKDGKPGFGDLIKFQPESFLPLETFYDGYLKRTKGYFHSLTSSS